MQLPAQPLPPGFEKKLFNGLPALELNHTELCRVCKCPRRIFRFDGSVTAQGRKRLVCVVCSAGESPARHSA
jgi:hypothetical protein